MQVEIENSAEVITAINNVTNKIVNGGDLDVDDLNVLQIHKDTLIDAIEKQAEADRRGGTCISCGHDENEHGGLYQRDSRCYEMLPTIPISYCSCQEFRAA